MYRLKRFAALFCAVIILFSFVSVPVHADGEMIIVDPALPEAANGIMPVAIGSWLVENYEEIRDGGDRILHFIGSMFNESTCGGAHSPNGRHKFVAQHTMVDGQAGNYYVCEYCGKSAGEVSNEAYNDYVGTLPMTGIDSAGGFTWTPTASDVVSAVFLISSNISFGSGTCSNTFPANFTYNNGITTVGLSSSGFNLIGIPTSGRDYISWTTSAILGRVFYRFPISGTYILNSSSPLVNGSYNSCNPQGTGLIDYDCSNNVSWVKNDNETDGLANNTLKHFSVNDIKGVGFVVGIGQNGLITATTTYSFPTFNVTPDATLSVDYTDNSRPASITGDYGIINQGGDLSVVHDHSIVNETDNSVYNPVTNETLSFDGWKYDYSTRTYTLTGGNNETTTVTYGDENITIQEGDTIYYVYYTVPQPEPPAHQHNYTGTVTTQPTCTMKGVKTYTCEVCGNSYTEAVPALGHDWQVKTQVQSEYNEQGEQTVQGYTIYKCSRCGEEKRSEDGIPPPSGGGDDTGLTIPDENGLQLLRDTLVNFFQTLPEMFGELTSFLNSTFSYVPQEIMTLIGFTVAVSVLMAFFKFFWR